MSEKDRTIEAVKREISPKVPCVNADADGYCKNGGFICCTCSAYRPVKAGKKQQADNSKSTGVSKCWRADADGNCEWSGKPCRMCASFVDEHDLKQQADNNKKATMKQPTYKMERIALADCKPHADAEAYSASSEDRAALSNSINESGLLSPIAVIPGEDGGMATEGHPARDKEDSKRTTARKTWYVIDGIGRLNALMAAGVKETDAQVFDLGDLSVAEFVVCKNAMMRKVTTGTRVMAYLKCHEREVLAAADPEKYKARPLNGRGRRVNAVSHETASNKGWSAKEIAERIGVSKNDVLAGIELLKATAESGEERTASVQQQGGGPKYEQMDLFETAEAVLRGETPIRRWKAAAGGKVSKVGGKAAADYDGIAVRTVRSLRSVWENWQKVKMDVRAMVLGEFRAALDHLPEDFYPVIEAHLETRELNSASRGGRGKRK